MPTESSPLGGAVVVQSKSLDNYDINVRHWHPKGNLHFSNGVTYCAVFDEVKHTSEISTNIGIGESSDRKKLLSGESHLSTVNLRVKPAPKTYSSSIKVVPGFTENFVTFLCRPIVPKFYQYHIQDAYYSAIVTPYGVDITHLDTWEVTCIKSQSDNLDFSEYHDTNVVSTYGEYQQAASFSFDNNFYSPRRDHEVTVLFDADLNESVMSSKEAKEHIKEQKRRSLKHEVDSGTDTDNDGIIDDVMDKTEKMVAYISDLDKENKTNVSKSSHIHSSNVTVTTNESKLKRFDNNNLVNSTSYQYSSSQSMKVIEKTNTRIATKTVIDNSIKCDSYVNKLDKNVNDYDDDDESITDKAVAAEVKLSASGSCSQEDDDNTIIDSMRLTSDSSMNGIDDVDSEFNTDTNGDPFLHKKSDYPEGDLRNKRTGSCTKIPVLFQNDQACDNKTDHQINSLDRSAKRSSTKNSSNGKRLSLHIVQSDKSSVADRSNSRLSVPSSRSDLAKSNSKSSAQSSGSNLVRSKSRSGSNLVSPKSRSTKTSGSTISADEMALGSVIKDVKSTDKSNRNSNYPRTSFDILKGTKIPVLYPEIFGADKEKSKTEAQGKSKLPVMKRSSLLGSSDNLSISNVLPMLKSESQKRGPKIVKPVTRFGFQGTTGKYQSTLSTSGISASRLQRPGFQRAIKRFQKEEPKIVEPKTKDQACGSDSDLTYLYFFPDAEGNGALYTDEDLTSIERKCYDFVRDSSSECDSTEGNPLSMDRLRRWSETTRGLLDVERTMLHHSATQLNQSHSVGASMDSLYSDHGLHTTSSWLHLAQDTSEGDDEDAAETESGSFLWETTFDVGDSTENLTKHQFEDELEKAAGFARNQVDTTDTFTTEHTSEDHYYHAYRYATTTTEETHVSCEVMDSKVETNVEEFYKLSTEYLDKLDSDEES